MSSQRCKLLDTVHVHTDDIPHTDWLTAQRSMSERGFVLVSHKRVMELEQEANAKHIEIAVMYLWMFASPALACIITILLMRWFGL